MGDLSWGKDVEFFQNVINTRIGLLKECYESLLLDLGPVCNKFEYENYYIENPCSFGGGGAGGDSTGPVNVGDWLDCVQKMSDWFLKNVDTYQGDPPKVNCGHHSFNKKYTCPLLNGKAIRDDCSGFVCACLWLHGVDVPLSGTGTMQPGSKFDQVMLSSGWVRHEIDWQQMPNNIQKGDIYVNDKQGHTEICWGPNLQMGWGSVQRTMPNKGSGYAHTYNGGHYRWMWRKGS